MRGRGLSRVYLILGIVVGVAGAVFARSRVAETSTMGRELGGEESPLTDTYVSSYEIVSAFPHDPAAFTQGLTFDSEGNLYESDGLYRHGRVRRVKARTGETIGQPTIMSPRHFAEGIAVRPAEHSTRLLQITWKEQVALEYTLPDLQLLSSTPLAEPREGWGLEISRDGAMLYVTDGGTYLYHLNATAPHERLAKLQITDQRLRAASADGRAAFPIAGVNELEKVGDELWGNVYPMYQGKASECLVRLNATTGAVLGWVDMRGLREASCVGRDGTDPCRQRDEVRRSAHNFVFNGVAYHEPSRRLYVTGKQWDKMYQVRVVPRRELGPEHVLSVCQLGHVAKG